MCGKILLNQDLIREGFKKTIESVIMIIPHRTPPTFFRTVISFRIYFLRCFFYQLGYPGMS